MILPIPIISSNQGIIEHENEPIELLFDLDVIEGNCNFNLNKINDTFFGLSIISNQNVTLFCNKSSRCDLGVGLNDFSRLSTNKIFLNSSKTIILINYYTCFIYPNIEKGYWLLKDYQLKPGWQEVEFNREGSVIID